MDIDALATTATPIRASRQDGSYPRPQLVRPSWTDLSGEWDLRFDDADKGLRDRWFVPATPTAFDRTITVPFPPESPASGINDTGYHPVVWYRRSIIVPSRDGGRTLLHFGAVDYRCSVWLGGVLLGHHEGGHTPFSFDVTDAVTGDGPHALVVRAEDDPLDVAQPRGKQDWELDPHVIWYHRTTGIWQPVWLETVPELHVDHLALAPDVATGSVVVTVELNRRLDADTRLEVELSYEGEPLATHGIAVHSHRVSVTVVVPRQINGQNYEELLWSDLAPRLIDVKVTLSGLASSDTIYSYFGLRSAAVDRGRFLLNDRPVFLRSVLSQGYWPESHLAAPSADALRAEVQLIKDLGFNSARVHQKIEDPRFLYWADRLGLLLWEEMPSAYEFSPTAARRVATEWSDVIRRDSSHPSIVTWVPLNESWGVQHISQDAAVRDHVRSLFHLTKSLDPSRPVVSNDGWEHLDSDIWSIHDYEESGEVLAARYADKASVDALFAGIGPAGRRLRLSDEPDRGQPVMLTEFGGVKFAPDSEFDDAWGYSTASSADDFAKRMAALLDAVRASEVLSGYCYTQLTDTGQETNGVVNADRSPKLPVKRIRAIMTGDGEADRDA
ncbi:glycoside hydrolase family 2 TIM barrel-domain containing protein [Conyzicola nivalis]|uniref:Beta-galactosidase n=2 Tax=Conyzicola nivalis TaxID=1477021 RepID=A0A916SBX8_9MICO|nr:beta-galactosidase [Conyzicola nivalis]